ncbi:MAG TPA: type I polyketide synthase [Actinoplanes sp.]|jgi:enediyne polyketide synthase
MGDRIAIVGIGLTYPDANSPDQLWENVLAGRRAFRRIPDERLNQDDYFSADPSAPDRHYSTKAAVLRDFTFDRLKYKVAGSTYRATDLTHWLALDVAAKALADAGFPDAEGLPRQATGVVLGNSLTGEFSRANLMRLRWPYVRRTVAAALTGKGWDAEQTATFLAELEPQYKAPFPPVDEDTLAGGLANTIAGRICNYFDLNGGGFTVDGACSSSLLSIVTAARALADGDSDVMLAGGVDLSIDPFELIGFAKTGALSTSEMKVYDRDSNGFWPGEGCGMVVLMREEDARLRGARIYATITGWGTSSDGKGGITRPEADGHALAVIRAYSRAGYGPATVAYLEGHGTGTALGDATEIKALSGARRSDDPDAPPAALGTIKGNIGHTKAAAGVAGLIKATLAVHHQVIPPATSHHDPHPLLGSADAAVYVPREATPWPDRQPVRAGVSAMGFGGINTHVALEQAGVGRHGVVPKEMVALVAGRQDAELLMLDGASVEELRERIGGLRTTMPKLSFAELTDLAGTLATQLTGGAVRAAVVASAPDEAQERLSRLLEHLDAGESHVVDVRDGIFLTTGAAAPKITFLFPGQGSGRGTVGAIRRRFAVAEETFAEAKLPTGTDQVATQVAQPRIVTGSLAASRVLSRLGIEADVAVGHSLGELTALAWGGALDGTQLIALARTRGEVMATASRGGGAMASIGGDPETTSRFIDRDSVVIAGYNGPHQTVVSGPAADVDDVCAAAAAAGVGAHRINVSHAFHSALVQPAADVMAQKVAGIGFGPVRRPVVSTVTAEFVGPDVDLRKLIPDQVLLPVRFHEAAAKAVAGADLVLEVGPGRVLTGLVEQIAPNTPVLAVDTDNKSLAPLLKAVGAAWALGAPVDTGQLFADRVLRPLPADGEYAFLASPCESAPEIDADLAAIAPDTTVTASPVAETPVGESTFDLVRTLMAERVELPAHTLGVHTHPLDDLHLSSITVGQIVNDVTRKLNRPTLAATANFATVSLGELAQLIDNLTETEQDGQPAAAQLPGVANWVRAFALDHVEQPLPAPQPTGAARATWSVYAPAGHRLADPLLDALAGAGLGDGVLLCLPDECTEDDTGLFLRAGQAVLAAPGDQRFVVVQNRFGAEGLAKTLHLEAPQVPTTVVGLPETEPADLATAIARVLAEVAATTGFATVRYDAAGTRTVPVLRALPPTAAGTEPLGVQDVMLVTGGGKGITAECAIAVASDSGARLALLGRADPAQDEELAANLVRMRALGIDFRYERADVTVPAQVSAAVDRLQAGLGPVTAVLHGAGRNEPAALANLDEETFRRTLAPKIGGLRAVLAAVDPAQIKLLITFGSIIGRAGLRGEAHYATANDWLTELTVRFGQEHPQARTLALEWSVWAGAGMGERLGVVEALMREGITPISTDDGIAQLRRVLADPSAGPVLVISGRAAGLPTLRLQQPELPLQRFVDRVMVHYAGIELITEADLSAGADPYLDDHLLDGDLLFPAVLGMEAMSQVASALTGRDGPPLLEDVEFLRPIVVRPGASTTIRVAALVRDADRVDVVIRSGETGFGADHFRARLCLPRPGLPVLAAPPSPDLPLVPIDPVTELYGGVLFQGKRFQRLLAYRHASARRAIAEISTVAPAPWFAPFLPQTLTLADPGTRDTMMHALQCCVPDATLLPVGVRRLHLAARADQEAEYMVLDACERQRDGDTYTYDVDVRDPSGALVERWEGLVLRAVRHRGGRGPWVPSLLGSHLERSLEDVLGGTRSVVVEPDPVPPGDPAHDRRAQTELAASRALGRPARLRYRADGRPETDGASVSASHAAGLTFVVAGQGRLACDAETVVARTPADWAALLGGNQIPARDLLIREAGDDEAMAGTRIWTALECLRKAGATTQALVVESTRPDGWAVLSAGDCRIATWATSLNNRPEPVVFAVLMGEN